jgi:hypothetical protein
MKPRVLPPPIDKRPADALVTLLRGMAPHYTPEWPAKDDDDSGVALLQVFASLSEGVIDRLNRAPDRNFFAFLDMLGIRLLPATPSRGPLRFVPATGLTGTVDVFTGAQASATGPAGPIPFETDQDLRVIAANMTGLVAVDPIADRIYVPPPGFLALDAVASDLPPHTVQAFAQAGSTTFQLDFADQLQPGDILSIQVLITSSGVAACAGESADTTLVSDYLVVADVKGSVVTLVDGLPRDYTEGTQVVKAVKFSLLEGKNVQQHVLYLAHNDYFSVKSEATFLLDVSLAGGTPAAASPLPVVWEFWGALASAPSAPDAWQAFQVLADGSSGFTVDGVVQLLKPAGEVKQTMVNGVNSRWIRARLNAPLPATPAPVVLRVDSIQLRVSQTGTGIDPDQAFNNDTPLSLNQPSPPFGFEPRTFDRFYLGSAEAFSKPGANVTLQVQLDTSELLGSPSAVFVGGKARVFAHGVGGVLDDFSVDLSTSNPAAPGKTAPVQIHPSPTGTTMTAASIPAAVKDDAGRIGVFVKADDGNIWLRWIPGSDFKLAQWINLQAPTGGKLQFDLAAVFLNGNWVVFVIVGGIVYSKLVNSATPNGSAPWNPLAPQNFTAASTPFADTSGGALRVVVFDAVANTPQASGHTQRWDGVAWKDVTPTGVDGKVVPGFLAAAGTRPWMQLFGLQQIDTRVFLRNQTGQLAVFDGSRSEIWGAPDNTTLQSSPVAFATATADIDTVRVFLRAAGDILAEAIHDPNGTPPSVWVTHNGPSEANLADEPYLLSYSGSSVSSQAFFSVFSHSDKNTMLEFRSAPASSGGGGGGRHLRAGPFELIHLATAIDASQDDMFVQLLDDPDKGKILAIVDGSVTTSFARLKSKVSTPIAAGRKYQIFEEIEHGIVKVPAGTKDQVELKQGTKADTGKHQFVLVGGTDGQLREIISKPDPLTVQVKSDFDPVPSDGDPYLLLVASDPEQALADAERTVLLAKAESSVDHAFDNQFLQFSLQGGGFSQPLQISQYFGADRAATLESSPSAGVSRGTVYQISAAPFPQAWFSYSDVDQSDLRPQLSWEYWNGRGWVNLPKLTDKTSNLLLSDSIKFTLPADIAQTEVAGQKNYWIRARIIGGDYGRETFSFVTTTDASDPKQPKQTSTVTVNKNSVRPPFIQSLKITYDVTQDQPPQVCLTFNNQDWLDQTAANNVTGKFYQPYVPLPVTQQTLYIGFDQTFEGGPVRLYFAARELPVDESNIPRLTLEYAAANDWKPLVGDDATRAFTRPDCITVSVPPDWQQRSQLGQSLFWIRARLTSGVWDSTPVFAGIFPNTCWAIQARTLTNEILGSGADTANATFHFQQVPVLPGEVVRVREVLTDEERRKIVDAAGNHAVFVVTDNQGKPIETWVRWNEVLEFYDSGPTDRVYRLDRADGEIQFGDGVNGRVPPIGGDNIVAFSYRAGGGVQGNIAAKQIDTLVTAIANIQTVSNPDTFGGGSEKAAPDDMLIFGPQEISNRGRAVTPADFEALAIEASRQVAKAHCVPDRNDAGNGETGWVSIYIVPDSTDPQPMPTLELRRTVETYLLDRVVVTLRDLNRIFVGPPTYVVVSVEATVFAVSLDKIGEAEDAVRQTLKSFLHPLTGGPDANGWDFGRELAASDLYAVLEDLPTVDHIGPITLHFGDQSSTDRVPVGPDQLLAGGEPLITMNAGGGN